WPRGTWCTRAAPGLREPGGRARRDTPASARRRKPPAWAARSPRAGAPPSSRPRRARRRRPPQVPPSGPASQEPLVAKAARQLGHRALAGEAGRMRVAAWSAHAVAIHAQLLARAAMAARAAHGVHARRLAVRVGLA